MSIDFEIAGENWKVAGKLMRTAQPCTDALYGRGSGSHTYFQQLFKIIDPFFTTFDYIVAVIQALQFVDYKDVLRFYFFNAI